MLHGLSWDNTLYFGKARERERKSESERKKSIEGMQEKEK